MTESTIKINQFYAGYSRLSQAVAEKSEDAKGVLDSVDVGNKAEEDEDPFGLFSDDEPKSEFEKLPAEKQTAMRQKIFNDLHELNDKGIIEGCEDNYLIDNLAEKIMDIESKRGSEACARYMKEFIELGKAAGELRQIYEARSGYETINDDNSMIAGACPQSVLNDFITTGMSNQLPPLDCKKVEMFFYHMKSTDDVKTLVKLLQNDLEGLSPEDRETFEKLSKFENKGGRFYFRSSSLFDSSDIGIPTCQTDAKGALLVIKNGLNMDMTDRYGTIYPVDGDTQLIYDEKKSLECIKNSQEIISGTLSHDKPATKRIWEQLPQYVRETLQKSSDNESRVGWIVNYSIQNAGLYDRDSFAGLELTGEANNLIAQSEERDLTQKESYRLNRLLIQAAFPGCISDPPSSLSQVDAALKAKPLSNKGLDIVLAILKRVDDIGYDVKPDLTKPPFNMPTDPMAGLQWSVENKTSKAMEQRCILNQLVRGEKVNLIQKGKISLTGADYSIELSQMLDFIKSKSEGLTETHKIFRENCRQLEEKEATLFVRMEDNSTRGALVPLAGKDEKESNSFLKEYAKRLSSIDWESAYYLLEDRGDMVILQKDGSLASVSNARELDEYVRRGTIADKTKFVDQEMAKKNLFMCYFVAPFKADHIMGYDDAPLRAMKIGSNANADMEFLRSDMPEKKNLIYEYLQKDEAQVIERMEPNTLMNDPATLSSFVYKTMSRHPKDGCIRFLVAGHGGAEKGLLPDGKDNNAEANSAMSVDDFARGIHDGVKQFNAEKGVKRSIDNLFLGSCLMGNTSFIYALSRYGDVKYLNASPEVMMGNDPNVFFEYVTNDSTAGNSPEKFARDMVDLVISAPSFPGAGIDEDLGKSMTFGKIYGAYDLAPEKGRNLAKCLKGFTKEAERLISDSRMLACMKEDVKNVDPYLTGIPMFIPIANIQQRDLIEVLEKFLSDARIEDKAFRSAATELIAATKSVVVYQRGVDDRYEQQGPSIYFPCRKEDFDDVYLKTSLMKDTGFDSFLKRFVGAA